MGRDMRILPSTRDEWVSLGLFPFKAYVVMGAPVMFLIEGYVGRKMPRYVRYPQATHAVCEGYFLCVAVLLLGAAIQAAACQRGSASRTLLILFVAFFILAALWPWGMIG